MSKRYLAAVFVTLSILMGQSVDARITWTFNFTDVGVGFDDPIEGPVRRLALQQSANFVSGVFRAYTANIAMSVNGAETDDNTLGAAGSHYVSNTNGFGNRGVVGQKILGASMDPNGTADDGWITWNFEDFTWDLFGENPGAFHFRTKMAHELLHAAGFISSVNQNGTSFLNAGIMPDNPAPFVPFDEFIAERHMGTTSRIIDGDTFALSSTRWNRASVGGTGTFAATNDTGLYFDGPHAKSVNGGRLVPLYSPTTWEDGSSGSHTDDLYFDGINNFKPVLLM